MGLTRQALLLRVVAEDPAPALWPEIAELSSRIGYRRVRAAISFQTGSVGFAQGMIRRVIATSSWPPNDVSPTVIPTSSYPIFAAS